MSGPTPGQRWISESEPELGLGTLLSHEYGRAEILFPATGEVRAYATASAPLRRIAFEAQDTIQDQDGQEHLIERISEDKGLLTYHCGDTEIPETQLYDHMSFSSPTERILAGRVDDYRAFALRTEGLRHKARIASSPVRGFTGGRIDLIPHQLSIANEVTSRQKARVLLADEVGLGKTIEACLILQHLHLTHRAERILIVLPEPLIHQWFIELLRRFNLLFSLFDEERCQAIEANDKEANPFLDDQLVICSLDFLSGDKKRAKQALAAGWDLLIVDEAHHLAWSPEKTSKEYRLVESLAAETEHLLMLTATPQQLGPEGHYARLRLLDPHRYDNLDSFIAESEKFEALAQVIDRLLDGDAVDAAELSPYTEASPQVRKLAKAYFEADAPAPRELVEALLDTFGTGRSLFRNTRQQLSGFPRRQAHLAPLKGDDELATKLDWLADFLAEHIDEKALLICRTQEAVEAISEGIQDRIAVDVAQFHEELTLLQRDRNAAFFAEAHGAQLLVCSEIGSEGRNFQFAHHLVLFDLPRDPELLEQRIGRLDRIGQSEDIQIHVPYLPKTETAVLAQWFHEGLEALEHNLHGATELAQKLAKELNAALKSPTPAKLKKLIERSQELKAEIGTRLAKGHDRLLAIHSSRPGQSAAMIEAIEEWDENTRFENYFIRLLDFYQLNIEDLDPRSYLITGNEQLTHKLPALPDEGIAMTFDRKTALSREDVHFASIDHPMLHGGLDSLLGSEMGNAAFAVWEVPGEKAIYLEAHYVIECLAPARLHVDRFLPPTPIRLVLDHSGKNQSQNEDLKGVEFFGGNIHKLLKNEAIKNQILPKLFKKLDQLAQEYTQKLIERVHSEADQQLQRELARLRSLASHNSDISEAEVQQQSQGLKDTLSALRKARPRLDAMRLIFKRPKSASR